MSSPATAFLALCAQNGVNPDSIPDAPARRSLFPPRKGSPLGRRGRPRTPESRDRRRMLGGSGALPPQLRHEYTEGERAVLTVIGGAVKERGACDLPNGEIAARAGVSLTLVHKTLRIAKDRQHIRITARPRLNEVGQIIAPNQTNVIEVVVPEWVSWLERGPKTSGRGGYTFDTKVRPTKRQYLYSSQGVHAEAHKVGNRRVPWAKSGPRYGGIRC